MVPDQASNRGWSSYKQLAGEDDRFLNSDERLRDVRSFTNNDENSSEDKVHKSRFVNDDDVNVEDAGVGYADDGDDDDGGRGGTGTSRGRRGGGERLPEQGGFYGSNENNFN